MKNMKMKLKAKQNLNGLNLIMMEKKGKLNIITSKIL